MTLRGRLWRAAVCLTALLLVSCASQAPATQAPAPTTPNQTTGTQESAGIMSSFSTTDLEGNPVDESLLAQYDLTMVNVWTTYCGYCLKEMPDLGELAAEYEPKGVRILGLVTDVFNSDGSISESQMEAARQIVAQTKADYPHIIPSQELYGILASVSAVPTTFFVDSQGRQVGSAYAGAQDKDGWIDAIERTLLEVKE